MFMLGAAMTCRNWWEGKHPKTPLIPVNLVKFLVFNIIKKSNCIYLYSGLYLKKKNIKHRKVQVDKWLICFAFSGSWGASEVGDSSEGEAFSSRCSTTTREEQVSGYSWRDWWRWEACCYKKKSIGFLLPTDYLSEVWRYQVCSVLMEWSISLIW